MDQISFESKLHSGIKPHPIVTELKGSSSSSSSSSTTSTINWHGKNNIDRSLSALSSFVPYSSDEVGVGGLELSHAPAAAAAADAVAEAAVVLLAPRDQAEEAEDLAQDVREGVLEVPVGHDVDERVERRVEVADPEEDVDDDV